MITAVAARMLSCSSVSCLYPILHLGVTNTTEVVQVFTAGVVQALVQWPRG
jgi:hypothetical protein